MVYWTFKLFNIQTVSKDSINYVHTQTHTYYVIKDIDTKFVFIKTKDKQSMDI